MGAMASMLYQAMESMGRCSSGAGCTIMWSDHWRLVRIVICVNKNFGPPGGKGAR